MTRSVPQLPQRRTAASTTPGASVSMRPALLGLLLVACATLPGGSYTPRAERWVAGIGLADSTAPSWTKNDAAFLAEIDSVPGGRQAMQGIVVQIHPGVIACDGKPHGSGCTWWTWIELSSGTPDGEFRPISWRETALSHEVRHIVDGK